VLLERDVPLPGAPLQSDSARVMRESEQVIIIEASLGGSSCLVLSDRDYPGWRARVDGVETLILRANDYLRAVALSAGAHTVEFTYEADSVRIGAAMSGLTTLALAFIAAGDSLRRIRRVSAN